MMGRTELEKDLSVEQIAFLADVRAGRKDPVFFAERMLGIDLHSGERIWLWMTTGRCPDKAYETGLELNSPDRIFWKTREEFDSIITKHNGLFLKNILVPSNRWGKTMVTSVKHIWYNYYKIGCRGTPENVANQRCGTLNLSPHSNQCQAGYDYVYDILHSQLVWVRDGKSYRNECRIPEFYVGSNAQKRMHMFNNYTFYKAIPTGEDQASSLAGTPYLYISYDECAQSLHLKEELPAKIMSRLIDFGGPLDLISTPEVDKPSHQYFFHIAKQGLENDEGWWTMQGQMSDNVFLGRKEVEQTIASIKAVDPIKYRQVVFGEFITAGKKMFDSILIERLWDEQLPQIAMHEHKYLVVADWGFADTGDPTVFYVLDYTAAPKYRVVFREAIRGGNPYAVLVRAKILQREYNGAKFIHDASSMGGVIIKKMLMEMQMHDIIDFSAIGDKADMLFCAILVMTDGRKTEAQPDGKIKELNPDFGRIRSYYIADLEEQLGNYQFNPDKGVTDKRIENDDVMALCMGLWWLERKLMRSQVKQINFNPLAPTLNQVFIDKNAQQIVAHSIVIPEKRIM